MHAFVFIIVNITQKYSQKVGIQNSREIKIIFIKKIEEKNGNMIQKIQRKIKKIVKKFEQFSTSMKKL